MPEAKSVPEFDGQVFELESIKKNVRSMKGNFSSNFI